MFAELANFYGLWSRR